MKASELRLGNLVNQFTRGSETINGIARDGKVYTIENWEDTSFFSPISLGEE